MEGGHLSALFRFPAIPRPVRLSFGNAGLLQAQFLGGLLLVGPAVRRASRYRLVDRLVRVLAGTSAKSALAGALVDHLVHPVPQVLQRLHARDAVGDFARDSCPRKGSATAHWN